jgi:hypothetical protein
LLQQLQLQVQLSQRLAWLASGVAFVRRGALARRNAEAVSSDFEAQSLAATNVASQMA